MIDEPLERPVNKYYGCRSCIEYEPCPYCRCGYGLCVYCSDFLSERRDAVWVSDTNYGEELTCDGEGYASIYGGGE